MASEKVSYTHYYMAVVTVSQHLLQTTEHIQTVLVSGACHSTPKRQWLMSFCKKLFTK